VAFDHQERVNELALKLVRAEQQLAAIHAGIETWGLEPPYRLDKETAAEGVGRYLWIYRLARLRSVPLEWSLLVGEFLYTLHSSLDHLAWLVAAEASAPAAPDRVTFPIFKNRQRFWRTDAQGRYRSGTGGWALERMPETARPLIEQVQPFQLGTDAPQHPLWLLHELSNEDKHMALHVVSSAVVEQELEVERLEHGVLGVIATYQLGIVAHLPNPPLRTFDSDLVSGSGEAY